mgnify:CR=1 FL=1
MPELDWPSIIRELITLFVVIDPVGSLPVFYFATATVPAALHWRFALRAVAVATVVLMLFLVAGQLVLEALGLRLGVQDTVHFAGWAAGEALIEEVRDADVFVFPSLREAGGAVLMEAMSCGVPVIAADWGGPADYVQPQTGLLVDASSPAAFKDGLREAMDQLAHDAGLRARLGAAGRTHALQNLDWSRRVDVLESIYRELLRDELATERTPAPLLSWPDATARKVREDN